MSTAPRLDWLALARHLFALLSVLGELKTPAGRQRARARVRSAIRASNHRRRVTSLRQAQVASSSGTSGQGSHSDWRPRQLAERLARRARRERAAGQRQRGSSSGEQAVRERYGDSFYSAIGARGGSTVLEERGVEYLQDIGARGGAVTSQRYGPEHYAEIGRKGGLAGRGRKRPRQHPNQPELPL